MGAIDIKSAGKIYPNGTRALEDVNITISEGDNFRDSVKTEESR